MHEPTRRAKAFIRIHSFENGPVQKKNREAEFQNVEDPRNGARRYFGAIQLGGRQSVIHWMKAKHQQSIDARFEKAKARQRDKMLEMLAILNESQVSPELARRSPSFRTLMAPRIAIRPGATRDESEFCIVELCQRDGQALIVQTTGRLRNAVVAERPLAAADDTLRMNGKTLKSTELVRVQVGKCSQTAWRLEAPEKHDGFGSGDAEQLIPLADQKPGGDEKYLLPRRSLGLPPAQPAEDDDDIPQRDAIRNATKTLLRVRSERASRRIEGALHDNGF